MIQRIAWKMTYKFACKWEKIAAKHELTEQVNECIQIQNKLMHIKSKMIERGTWK